MVIDYGLYGPLDYGKATITLWELWDVSQGEPCYVKITSDLTSLRLAPGMRILKREYVPASIPTLVNEAT